MKRKTKIFIATIIGCITFFCLKPSDHIQMLTYPTICDADYDEDHLRFANIKDMDIYITPDINFMPPKEDDIVIIDLRDEKEDIKILSSHKINDPILQSSIIDIILKYNLENPSNKPWIRTKDSLQNEWLAHNLAYAFCYERERTADVDFENKEEEDYKIKLLH